MKKSSTSASAPAPASSVSTLILILAATLTTLTILTLCSCSKDKLPKESEPALTVNGKTITIQEIDEVLEAFRLQQMILNPERVFDGEGDLRRGAARQLASSLLMLDDVRARGWTVPAPVVDSVADNIINRMGGRETFIARLSEMGETEENLRKDIADGILLDSLMKIMSGVAEPTDSGEIAVFYKENRDRYVAPGRVRTSHIIFAYNPASDDPDHMKNIMEKANEALVKAQGGEDFEKLVKEYSSMPDAGDMGWFKKGDLTPDLEITLFALKNGEISGLVPSGMGVHILKKTGEDESRQMELEEVSDRIRRTLDITKREKRVNGYIDSLLATAQIRFADQSLDFLTNAKNP